MLHRISIFDLSTLEVMRKGKAIVLSNVGGNPEFNRKGNIILCDGPKQAATAFPVDLKSLGSLNKEVYERCFSNEIFKKSYLEIFEDLRGH